jgi:hypothetical protein
VVKLESHLYYWNSITILFFQGPLFFLIRYFSSLIGSYFSPDKLVPKGLEMLPLDFNRDDISGSGLRILHNNETQAQLERNTINYNSKIAQQSKFNEANFARIQGQVARQAGRSAAIGTLASAAFSFGQSKPGQTLLGNIPNPFA